MDQVTDFRRRWYDGNEEVTIFVAMLEAIPERVQDLFCEAALEIANRYEEENMTVSDRIKTAREDGDKETIRKLKMSQYRRRLYDQHLELHRIMNYLLLITHSEQQKILTNVQEVIQYVVDYITLCKRFERDAEIKALRQIIEIYLDGNLEQLKSFIRNQEHFFRRQTISHEDIGSKIVKATPVEDD